MDHWSRVPDSWFDRNYLGEDHACWQVFSQGKSSSAGEPFSTYTVTGDWVDEKRTEVLNPADGDINLQPDPTTICLVPWAQEPTAQVIHDCLHMERSAIEISPPNVLRWVLALYEKEAWG